MKDQNDQYDLSEPKHRLYYIVTAVARRLKQTADDALLKKAGLTTSQATALRIIVTAGCITQKQIADTLGQHESAITTMSRRLVKAGFVTKTRSEADGRAWELKPTAQGKKAVKNLLGAFTEIDALVDKSILPQRIDQLSDDLLAILYALNAQHAERRNSDKT